MDCPLYISKKNAKGECKYYHFRTLETEVYNFIVKYAILNVFIM